MSALVILIPIALLLGLAGLAAFLWAMRSGQFDDLDGAAQRILYIDEQDEGPGQHSRDAAASAASRAPGPSRR